MRHRRRRWLWIAGVLLGTLLTVAVLVPSGVGDDEEAAAPSRAAKLPPQAAREPLPMPIRPPATPTRLGAGMVTSLPAAPAPTPRARRATGPFGTPSPSGDRPGWRLVHVDDFTTDTLQSGPYTIYGDGWISGDKPDTSYWKSGNVQVRDGRLLLLAKPEEVTVEGRTSVRMTTGAITLWDLPQQTYGRYEVSVRIEPTRAVSYAWLLWPWRGDNWPQGGEVDFAEDRGGDRSETTATYNYGPDGVRKVLPQRRITPKRDFSQWHVLGVEWLPGRLNYLLDGKIWASNTSPEISDEPMVLILQTEGVLRKPPAEETQAEIDWVAVYALA